MRSISLESCVKDRKARLKSCDARDASLQNEAQLVLYTRITPNQERMKVREVIPHIGPIPIVIPLKLFLDLLRDPVSQEG